MAGLITAADGTSPAAFLAIFDQSERDGSESAPPTPGKADATAVPDQDAAIPDIGTDSAPDPWPRPTDGGLPHPDVTPLPFWADAPPLPLRQDAAGPALAPVEPWHRPSENVTNIAKDAENPHMPDPDHKVRMDQGHAALPFAAMTQPAMDETRPLPLVLPGSTNSPAGSAQTEGAVSLPLRPMLQDPPAVSRSATGGTGAWASPHPAAPQPAPIPMAEAPLTRPASVSAPLTPGLVPPGPALIQPAMLHPDPGAAAPEKATATKSPATPAKAVEMAPPSLPHPAVQNTRRDLSGSVITPPLVIPHDPALSAAGLQQAQGSAPRHVTAPAVPAPPQASATAPGTMPASAMAQDAPRQSRTASAMPPTIPAPDPGAAAMPASDPPATAPDGQNPTAPPDRRAMPPLQGRPAAPDRATSEPSSPIPEEGALPARAGPSLPSNSAQAAPIVQARPLPSATPSAAAHGTVIEPLPRVMAWDHRSTAAPEIPKPPASGPLPRVLPTPPLAQIASAPVIAAGWPGPSHNSTDPAVSHGTSPQGDGIPLMPFATAATPPDTEGTAALAPARPATASGLDLAPLTPVAERLTPRLSAQAQDAQSNPPPAAPDGTPYPAPDRPMAAAHVSPSPLPRPEAPLGAQLPTPDTDRAPVGRQDHPHLPQIGAPDAPRAETAMPADRPAPSAPMGPSPAVPIAMPVSDSVLSPLPRIDGGSGQPGTAPATQSPPTALPDLVVRQVLPNLAAPGAVSVTLAPVDLGLLQFEVTQRGDSLHLHLTVEMPATLDLLRRQGDQMIAELRQAGFANASLSFAANDGQAGNGQTGNGQAGHGHPGSDGRNAPMTPVRTAQPPPQDLAPSSPLRASVGTLDLRL